MELKNLVGIALVFIVIAITIGIAGDILGNFRDKYNTNPSNWVANDTTNKFTSNSLVMTIAQFPSGTFRSIDNSSITLYNQTNQTIGKTNYYPFPNGSIILADGAVNKLSNAYVWMNYTFFVEEGSVMYNSSQYGNKSEEEVASWLPTIAIIVMAAIIIGIITLYFKIS